MNVRELIDTVEAKIDLLASQQRREDRNLIHREIDGHIGEMRDALGLPHDVLCCCQQAGQEVSA